ncbi:hypothetical protein ACK3TF_003300 [Chlorella vulgaris]
MMPATACRIAPTQAVLVTTPRDRCVSLLRATRAIPAPCRRLCGAVATPPVRRRLSAAAATGPGGSGPGGNSAGDRQQRKDDQQIILGICLALTVVVLLALKLGGDALQDADAWDLGYSSFSGGDTLGAFLWGTALWFVSPLQLLLLFFGAIETERPSDWLMQQLGRAAGLDVDAIDYKVPVLVRLAAVATFAASGVAIAASSSALLGDEIWAVSTGLGTCMAAGMFEVGRPKRMSVEEAQEKEAQWQEFAKFANVRLERRGRCHETEIVRALQRDLPKYREGGSAALDSSTLRKLVRNWAPEAERSSNGYYKNIQLARGSISGSGSDSADI